MSPTRTARGLVLALAWVAAVLPGLPAHAQVPDKSEAASRYRRGVEFYKEGDYSAALAEFEAAYRATPTYEVLFNIGLSQRRLYRYGEAVRTLKRYLDEGGARVSKQRRADVENELTQVRALTASVTVNVPGSQARVLVDGTDVGKTPLAEALVLGPGRHTVRVERAGDLPEEREVQVVSGQALTLDILLRADPSRSEVLVSIDSQPPGAVITIDGLLQGATPLQARLQPGSHEVLAAADGYVTSRTDVVVVAGQERTVTAVLERVVERPAATPPRVSAPGIITSGVGLALWGGAIALGISAGSAGRQVGELYQAGGTWTQDFADLEASAQRSQTWAWVLGTAGSVALATGLVLIIARALTPDEPYSEEAQESAWLLAPTREGLQLVWARRF